MLQALLSDVLRHTRRDDGAVVVLFALMLPVIIGVQALTVDATRAFAESRMLQNAADAGALAAAVYLPTTNSAVLHQARQTAIDYAALNGVSITSADVVFTTVGQPNDRVTVRASRDVALFFAPTFGVTLTSVGREGGAQIGILGGIAGVVPLGVEPPEDGMLFGEPYCLKLGSGNGGALCNSARQGNFQAIDIDDYGNASGDTYRDLIITGSHSVVRVGNQRGIVSGNMQGPTTQGIGCNGGGRLNGDNATFDQIVVANPNGGYDVLDWTNPRLVLIPMVSYTSSYATILGFAVFFIDQCGSNGAVIGRFIDTMVPGGEWIPLNGASDFGTRVARLVA